jgi:hypothetical protein
VQNDGNHETVSNQDERLVLDKYRSAKKMGHAAIEIFVKDGVLVRLTLQEHVDLDKTSGIRKVREIA